MHLDGGKYVSELGLQAAIHRAAVTAPPIAQQAAVATVAVPSIVRVPVPPREEERQRPRKAAAQMQPPREQSSGTSPLASLSLADGNSGAAQVQQRKANNGAVNSELGNDAHLDAEQEADNDFRAGRFTTFERDDDFVASLR